MASIYSSLVAALSHRDVISDAEKSLIETFVGRTKSFSVNDEIVAEGSTPTEACLVLSGFAGRIHYFLDGRRQFSALHHSGDFVDLHSLVLKVMDHSVVALTPCTVVFITHDSIRSATEKSPHLGRLLWMLTVVDAAIHRAWLVSLARRPATAHVAHFMCEVFTRLSVVGLTDNNSFAFPIRQGDLADLIGISAVHLNRSVQTLRKSGLIKWKDGILTIPDPEALFDFAEFNPTYLSLTKRPR
jgi:CRP-like cAMP-binding protein